MVSMAHRMVTGSELPQCLDVNQAAGPQGKRLVVRSCRRVSLVYGLLT